MVWACESKHHSTANVSQPRVVAGDGSPARFAHAQRVTKTQRFALSVEIGVPRTPPQGRGNLNDDDVVYWYSFSNHYTKRAFTQP